MQEVACEMSEGEASEGDLKIVIESPKRKSSKKSRTQIDLVEKQIIESTEDELEEKLEEKASKNNLTTNNVKHILRQVVTNEHVLALVRHTENQHSSDGISFVPKLTRAKFRELNTETPLPWLNSAKPPPEVQQLISAELDEDSSGDEYVPVEEESEDDRDSTVISETDVSSISPAKSVNVPESPGDVHWTDDGIFKIPQTKAEKEEEEANIALRTRSKLSLSATPLEIIEEAFIPPDITTDMYDMDCDDDDWRDFLKKFTRPLDEITKAAEDEDHDPEYNILADEETDEVDVEELRTDKAVNVTKKELNALIAELFECTNDFSEIKESVPKINLSVEEPQVIVLENDADLSVQEESRIDDSVSRVVHQIEPSCNEFSYNSIIRVDQRLLIEQQMRQHVQLLTQNFLSTYEHPEYHDSAIKFKENLVNFKFLKNNNPQSAFNACNLEGAINLIQNWEEQLSLNTDEVRLMKQHVARVIHELKESSIAGTEYIPTFPKLVMETISRSEVFIYPALLPRIPFKPLSIFKRPHEFLKSEDELIALGMEQFTPYFSPERHNLNSRGEVKLRLVCQMIVQYMMPSKDINKLYCHIFNSKHPNVEMNAIKFYFEKKKAPTTLHYVVELKDFGAVPPCKRQRFQLPYQWMKYLFPEDSLNETTFQPSPSSCINKITKPPAYNKNFLSKASPKRKIIPKPNVPSPVRRNSKVFRRRKRSISPFTTASKAIVSSTPYKSVSHSTKKKLEHYFSTERISHKRETTSSCVNCMKFNSSIFSKVHNSSLDMLPSMPFLGATSNVLDVNTSKTPSTSFSTSISYVEKNTETDNSTVVDGDVGEIVEKDNEDDITALMIASSTIKNFSRRNLSRAEKRKEKLRKEYTAQLAMLSPEDPVEMQEKAQSYAQAYFDKARERLEPEDYQKFMEILNSFGGKANSVSDLYKQMEQILGKKDQDLMDEFLTFLTPAQAKNIGKLIPYYMLNNMSLFLRKLEIYFKDQPGQLRKIYRSLTELSTSINVTMDRVKHMILPLLKGNELLTDWFLQIFPGEPPPKSLFKGPWEEIDIRREGPSGEEAFDTVTVPEAEDNYGGPNCICLCHQKDDLMFKSRSQHCTPCGLKFLQGRVYIQTGKGLRLANVTFNNSPDVDHNARLNCSLDRRKRRSDTSPSKQITSPVKESLDEVRVANDSEDENDCGRKKNRITRSPRKKRVKFNDKLDKNDKLSAEAVNSKIDETIENVVVPLVESTAKPNDEVTEWDCNTSIESIEVRNTPEHSAESESEFCEESSQDNINTETDDSAEELESMSNSPVHSENSNNSNASEEISWTRDEDKIILETLQKEGSKEDTFVRISVVLKNRSVPQIKERFNTLMSLLQEMTSGTNL